MSAYDTIDRGDAHWVRVYCETPMDLENAVLLEVGKRQSSSSVGVVFLDPPTAIRIAIALLNAAQEALHAAKVDSVVGGG